MSVFKMNNFVRSCLICSRLRNRQNRTGIFPPSAHFLPKRYQSLPRDISDTTDVNLSEDFDYSAESPYSNIDFEVIANGDADKLKAFKILQLEIDLMRQQGEKVPSRLNTQRWKNLLTMQLEERVKYLQHLWVNEMKTIHAKEKAQKKSEAFLQFKAERKKAGPKFATTNSPMVYSLNDTTLFHRIYDITINRYYYCKLFQAEWFGPKILVDCSYEPFMNFKNVSNCVKQMIIMWSDNRDHCNPYDLIFCNVDKDGVLWEKFASRVPMVNDESSPVHFTYEHYLNLFPKQQLVYLTPHCPEVLEKFDPDDIYIIGAFVDTGSGQPVSLAKAKKDGLRMAKFPLDKYLCWLSGHKVLTLDQVLRIMTDLKDGQSWKQAFRHVPRRKISTLNLIHQEEDVKPNPHSTKTIRENYRKNFVYDLLLKDRLDSNKS